METLSPVIKCPKCGTEIPLSETIAAPLIEKTRAEAETKLREALEGKSAAERTLAEEQQKIELERGGIETEAAKQLSAKLSAAEKAQSSKLTNPFSLLRSADLN